MAKVVTFGSSVELENAFKRFKTDTKSSWRCFHTEKSFGSSTDAVLTHFKTSQKEKRFLWSLKAVKGLELKYDGTPFVVVGKKHFCCHQGPDLDKAKKRRRKEEIENKEKSDHFRLKRRNLIQDSKKVDCPAEVYMNHIIKFIDCKIDKDTVRKRKLQTSLLRQRILNGEHVATEAIFQMKLPSTECHRGHPIIGLGANVREQVDPLIVKKITDLFHDGVRLVKEIERHVTSYVEGEIFRGRTPPPKTQRKWYPTDVDIRNILALAKAADRKVPDDQQNLDLFCLEWKSSNADDVLFFRPSSCMIDKEQEEPHMEKMLFVYQSSWQKYILSKYGQNICLMDATYRTSRYSLPLFFLCVRTNISYCVAAIFITQNEDTDSLIEALKIIKESNAHWTPKHFMVDYSLAEINALESCFPESKVLICDFHREKAWSEWVTKKEHDCADCSTEILRLLRNIAKSRTESDYTLAVKRFKESKIWKDKEKLRNYYCRVWENQSERWVRAFRDETLLVAIHTNNGVERQNEWLKSTYLHGYRNCTISELVKVLLKQFIPDSHKKYIAKNCLLSEGYRKYSDDVPPFLRNRPKDVLDHIMKRSHSGYPVANITVTDKAQGTFQGKSEDGKEVYTVHLGSDKRGPYCSCWDWREWKLPCKHLCAVMKLPDYDWPDLGECFWSNPILSMDTDATGEPSCPDSNSPKPTTEQACEDSVSPSSPETTGDAEVVVLEISDEDSCSDFVLTALPKRKRKRQEEKTRESCISSLKSITDMIYQLDNNDVLSTYDSKFTEIVSDLRSLTPTVNSLPKKKKSPRKKVTVSSKKKYGTLKMSFLRRFKNKYSSRYGKKAESMKNNCKGV